MLALPRFDIGFGIGSVHSCVREQGGHEMQGSIDATSLNRREARVRIFVRHMSACFRCPSLPTLVAIVGVFFAGTCFEGAFAQPRINSDDGPELRTLYANSQDIAEGKRIVESSCAGCHGANGISESPGVPHLAGQRPAYLYLELRAYQAGVRGEGAMNNVVRPLSDDALFKAAVYFASLDPPQTNAANGAKAAAPDPVQAGKTAAAGCAGCHGDGGISKTPGMPSLVGLDPKYLVAAMKAYKSGQRKNDRLLPALTQDVTSQCDFAATQHGTAPPATRSPRRPARAATAARLPNSISSTGRPRDAGSSC